MGGRERGVGGARGAEGGRGREGGRERVRGRKGGEIDGERKRERETLGFLPLRKREVPVIVPPVPTPPRNTSILPSVCGEVGCGVGGGLENRRQNRIH